MTYLSSLSKAQWVWLIGTLAVCVAIVTVGWLVETDEDAIQVSSFTTDMCIRDIAPKLGVTGKSLARELGLPLDVPKRKPLKKLDVSQTELDEVAKHLASHRSTNLRYYVFVALVLWGLVFLRRLGRPDGSLIEQRKIWYPRMGYLLALVAAGMVFGFLLGKSPNPMEGVVKVFKSMVGLYPSVVDKVIAFAFFIVLAVVGNKLVCGWACPFGALQELLYSLPLLRRLKRRKIPFLLSNGIRATLFVATLLVLFGLIGGRKGSVLYHSLNPFNLFNLDFDHAMITITICVALGVSLFAYRPFCQFICPFGFVSWLVERFSLTRVRIDSDRCNKCGACIKACPLEAAKHKVDGKLFAADCYSCARCLNVCPQDAITYGPSLGRKSREEKTTSDEF